MARRSIRRPGPALLVLAWLAVGGGLDPFTGRLTEVATNDQAAFPPQSAESTRVLEAQDKLRRSDTRPVIVGWTSDGAKVTPEQSAAATRALATLSGTTGVVGTPTPATGSADGLALRGVMQLSSDPGDLGGILERIGTVVAVEGMTARLAGPGGHPGRPVRRLRRHRRPAARRRVDHRAGHPVGVVPQRTAAAGHHPRHGLRPRAGMRRGLSPSAIRRMTDVSSRLSQG